MDEEILEASERFYDALTRLVNGDSEPMTQVWSRDADSVTMHPTGGRQVGWPEIERSWAAVASLASEGQVSLHDRHISFLGADIACESGIEQGRSRLAGREVTFEHRTTNIYRREGEEWKIVHHHADRSREMADIVSSSEDSTEEEA